jgi:hypothetical protein
MSAVRIGIERGETPWAKTFVGAPFHVHRLPRRRFCPISLGAYDAHRKSGAGASLAIDTEAALKVPLPICVPPV